MPTEYSVNSKYTAVHLKFRLKWAKPIMVSRGCCLINQIR